jgi:hypothetical protein
LGRYFAYSSYEEFIVPNETFSSGRIWHLSFTSEGCQRVFEPVSRLFFINPYTEKVKGHCKEKPLFLKIKQ